MSIESRNKSLNVILKNTIEKEKEKEEGKSVNKDNTFF